MLDLQQLLKSAQQQALEAKAKARKRAERPSIFDAAERHQHDWEHTYVREAYIARFVHQVCTTCGNTQQSLMGIYEQRKHPRVSDRQTKLMSPDSIALMDPGIPRQLHLQTEQVQACIYCTHQLGFETRQLPEMIRAKTQGNN